MSKFISKKMAMKLKSVDDAALDDLDVVHWSVVVVRFDLTDPLDGQHPRVNATLVTNNAHLRDEGKFRVN